jgi:hypothetical protein
MFLKFSANGIKKKKKIAFSAPNRPEIDPKTVKILP